MLASGAAYWVTWFPGSLLATFGVLTLAYKGVRSFVRVSDAIPTLLDAAAELHNNGGKSVKDDVQHIKRVQAVMKQDLLAVDARVQRIEAKQ